MSLFTPDQSPLGKQSAYQTQYDPKQLFPIPRLAKREEIAVPEALPFHGVDYWNCFELSWLDDAGKPMVALAEISLAADSINLVESKSLKLYFNSFNQTAFASSQIVANTIKQDLAAAAEGEVDVKLTLLADLQPQTLATWAEYQCLDHMQVEVDCYQPNPEFLIAHGEQVTEHLCSHVLKSNCLVTGQPDWGSVLIVYRGAQIQHEGLLKYLISFREHNEFHEQCVERIFMDIMRQCQPEQLTVYARYTRRGGIDINPFRSNFEKPYPNTRLVRQ